VVGTQCIPRPLSPCGWGYPLSASGEVRFGAAGGRAASGGAAGAGGFVGFGRLTGAVGWLGGASDAEDGLDVFGGAGLYALGDGAEAWFCFIGLTYGLCSAAAARAFDAEASWVAKLDRPRSEVDGIGMFVLVEFALVEFALVVFARGVFVNGRFVSGVFGSPPALTVAGSARSELSPNTSSRMSDASSASRPRRPQYSRYSRD
jgi:hypothetical protein